MDAAKGVSRLEPHPDVLVEHAKGVDQRVVPALAHDADRVSALRQIVCTEVYDLRDPREIVSGQG
jgi:hypothetical protein